MYESFSDLANTNYVLVYMENSKGLLNTTT